MSEWHVATLSDVLIEAKPGFACGEDTAGGVFQFRMNNITTEGQLDLSKKRRVPRNYRNLDAFLVEPGDVLFNATNSPELVGKSAFFPGHEEPAVFSNHFLRLRPLADKLDGGFLARWLALQFQQRVFQGMSRQWVNQATVGRDSLLKLSIRLPTVSEQRRIAEVLDQAEALRAKRRAALAELDSLTVAIFFELFGAEAQTPVTIGDNLQQHRMGWRWEVLREVARLATGHTPDRQRPDYWNGDIPWITLTEIRRLDGTIATATSEMVTQEGIDHSAAVRLPAGTVCFSRTASIGFVTVMGREMATSQDFVNWVCGPRLEPIYLMHALLRSRERLRALSTGSTHKTIYFPTVEQFRVLVPPIDLQQSFAHRLGRVEQLRSAYRASLAELDALFASLQHRAFRGEL